MRKIGVSLATAGFLFGLSAVADAFDFRCGTELIGIGDTKPEVIAECGDPTHVERLHTSVLLERGGVLWPIAVDEEWIYNLGPQEFIRILRFRDGRVIDIQHGGYGWQEKHPSAVPRAPIPEDGKDHSP
jgi:hypothetical protein